MIGSIRFDYTCETEHQSIGVGFYICPYAGDWFNNFLLSRVDRPIVLGQSVYTEEYGIRCFQQVCVLQAGTRCDTNVTILTYRFYTHLWYEIMSTPFLLKQPYL